MPYKWKARWPQGKSWLTPSLILHHFNRRRLTHRATPLPQGKRQHFAPFRNSRGSHCSLPVIIAQASRVQTASFLSRQTIPPLAWTQTATGNYLTTAVRVWLEKCRSCTPGNQRKVFGGSQIIQFVIETVKVRMFRGQKVNE